MREWDYRELVDDDDDDGDYRIALRTKQGFIDDVLTTGETHVTANSQKRASFAMGRAGGGSRAKKTALRFTGHLSPLHTQWFLTWSARLSSDARAACSRAAVYHANYPRGHVQATFL